MTYTNSNYHANRPRPCPHGDVYGMCDRGACDE